MTAPAQTTDLSAGTWAIDPVHSSISFSVRHLVVSKVRGTFGTFSGAVTVAADGTPSVSAEIDVASVHSGNEQRDAHLRAADFFDVEKYPTATFVSASVTPDGDDYRLEGDFTLKGVTRPIVATGTISGPTEDFMGNTRLGLSLTTTIDRSAYGVSWNAPLPKGGNALSNEVELAVELEFHRA